jgi:hypothetical protein
VNGRVAAESLSTPRLLLNGGLEIVKSMRDLISRANLSSLILLCLLLTGCAASSQVTAASSTLELEVSLEPSQLINTFLGFYTVQCKLSIIVKIRNAGSRLFQGGNLTVQVIPPSEKWTTSWEVRIPYLAPGKDFSDARSFQPVEGGVYVIKVVDLHYDSGQIMGHELGGFVAVYVSPIEFLLPLYVSFVSILISFISLAVSLYGNRRMKNTAP